MSFHTISCRVMPPPILLYSLHSVRASGERTSCYPDIGSDYGRFYRLLASFLHSQRHLTLGPFVFCLFTWWDSKPSCFHCNSFMNSFSMSRKELKQIWGDSNKSCSIKVGKKCNEKWRWPSGELKTWYMWNNITVSIFPKKDTHSNTVFPKWEWVEKNPRFS